MDISNEEKDRIARADLEKLEYDIRAEAETAVEDFDAMGDEGAAAAAAETAGEFDEAMREAKEPFMIDRFALLAKQEEVIDTRR